DIRQDKNRFMLPAPVNAGVKEADCKPYSLKLTWDKVEGADSYEIEFDRMTYFHILDNEFLFEDLQPDTEYKFKLCARCKDDRWGNHKYAIITARTSEDPFEQAIKGVTATCTAPSQPGQGLDKLFDFDPESQWHTEYNTKAVPFDLLIDLHSVNTLDKLQYLPRNYGYNGIILEGQVFTSMDKQEWSDCGTFRWERDALLKEIDLSGRQARYIKIKVAKAFGDFGSGQDIYIFRQPGSSYYIPGDINSDGVLDENDLMSYMNYMGLRQGDGDFEGYVSKGDINGNGLIDAYDVSNAAAPMIVAPAPASELGGTITVETDKATYKAGEEIVVTIKGSGLSEVNAFSLVLPYAEKKIDFVGCEPQAAKDLRNFSRDRLHTNGQKAYYVTFVGVGEASPLNGDHVLCTLRFKALSAGAASIEAKDIILVDSQLNYK
ncbi:MAG: discoidin domain-containing protein, partial [Bacteroidaceae bacterium]|nr:discoidin domain-containing protein [Bacteroidaceae bacterium]